LIASRFDCTRASSAIRTLSRYVGKLKLIREEKGTGTFIE